MSKTIYRKYTRGRTQTTGRFSQQVKDFSKKAGRRKEEFISKVSERIAIELVVHTPVRSGLLRGSWKVGFHTNVAELGTPDPSGARVISEMRAKINARRPGQNVYFVNTAGYSWYVETGTTKFAGRYYVHKARAKITGILREVLAEVTK